MEILTYKKVYQLVGDDASGTNECITKSAAVEIAQAHRKDITSNLSQYLNNEYIDIFSVEDKPDLTAKYNLYVGLSTDKINDNTVSLVWQSDQYGESSKKTVYVNAYKEFINESNEVVSTESVEYSITSYSSQSKFSVNKNGTLVDFYPLEENTDYSSSKEVSLRVSIPGQKNKFCTISLIQERKGIQLVSGDAIMFTYNWDKGTDLDQATYVNLNSKSSNDQSYAGFHGKIPDEYKNILYFAGDNQGKGNEYAFVDFKSIVKYLSEHGDDESSVDGKTILQSLTNENGVIYIQCNLYTNWYGVKEQEDITLSYSVYNKDSENASVKPTDDKQFVLTGYTKKSDNTQKALCYSKGISNVYCDYGINEVYTLSAKFTYYLNSGVFVFETNKDDVGKWQKGVIFTTFPTTASYSGLNFIDNDETINYEICIDSLNEPSYFDKNAKVGISAAIKQTISDKVLYVENHYMTINQLPFIYNKSVELSEIARKIDFGENDSAEIYPNVFFSSIYDKNCEKMLHVSGINLTDSAITIHKQLS